MLLRMWSKCTVWDFCSHAVVPSGISWVLCGFHFFIEESEWIEVCLAHSHSLKRRIRVDSVLPPPTTPEALVVLTDCHRTAGVDGFPSRVSLFLSRRDKFIDGVTSSHLLGSCTEWEREFYYG